MDRPQLEVAISALKPATGSLDPSDARLEDPSEERPDPSDRPGKPIDGFGTFIRRTLHPVLTLEQERSLGVRLERGRLAADFLAQHPEIVGAARRDFRRQERDGMHAADELAMNNLRLVLSIAKRSIGRCSPAIEYEDLVQEGYLGLAHAISKWDYRRNLKFSTYATWWIRQSIDRALGNQARTIRLPIHVSDRIRLLTKTEFELTTRHRLPSDERIAKELGWKRSEVADLRKWRRGAVSLDATTANSRAALGQFLDGGGESPESVAIRRSLPRALDEALRAVLTGREVLILTVRFGLGTHEPCTLEEAGDMLGVSRERARQIEAQALAKLLREAHSTGLHELAGKSEQEWLKSLERARKNAKGKLKEVLA